MVIVAEILYAQVAELLAAAGAPVAADDVLAIDDTGNVLAIDETGNVLAID